jgi:type IV secretory pathway VirJ component
VFDFCGSTTLHAPLCPGNGLRAGSVLPTQTFTPAGSSVDVLVRLRSSGTPSGCPSGTPAAYAASAQPSSAFQAAFASLAASAHARATSPPTDLADIPLVEVLPRAPDHTDAFAVFISGDGGWAGFDRELSAELAARGLPVVGLDSLRYFWSPRTPDGIAADLDRVIQRYQNAWKRKRVVLIGFSQGADVLPFIVNRLSDRTRASVASAIALSISTDATFEFHLADWVGASGDRPTLPEIQQLARSSFICVYGTGDDDSVCPRLDAHAFRVIELPGGHHFGGDAKRLSTIVLDTLGPT